MNRNNLIGTVIIAIVGAIGLRVWWYWPKELPGGRYLDRIEKRGQDYTLHPKNGASLSDIVTIHIFEGYHPSNHSEFEENIQDRPSKFVKNSDHHHYMEYMGKYGRMLFHSEFHEEEGLARWLEFIPIDLPVDNFLAKDVAISLDLTQPEFKVYIQLERQHMYRLSLLRTARLKESHGLRSDCTTVESTQRRRGARHLTLSCDSER
jgi:hypothetical protein